MQFVIIFCCQVLESTVEECNEHAKYIMTYGCISFYLLEKESSSVRTTLALLPRIAGGGRKRVPFWTGFGR